MYCPKCGSRLYPDDEKYIRYAGVCSYCVSYDGTTDKRYKTAYLLGIEQEKKSNKPKRKKART